MHEGLRVDPATGCDEGPPLGGWGRVLRLPGIVAPWSMLLFWVLPRGMAWPLFAVWALILGSKAALLGLEAQALARCADGDTRASRQLRWERSVLVGPLALLAGWGCALMAVLGGPFLPSSPLARGLLGLCALAAVSGIVVGIPLAFRHRPATVGPAPQPPATA